jgi:hypothetical protein
MQEIWSFEHSVDCPVPAEFAWIFWTDVRNWALDADVASIELDGPFAVGTNGVTHSISAGRIKWRITEVQPGRAVLEFPGPGVLATFEWTFEPRGNDTHIIQRAWLTGDHAPAHVLNIAQSLEAGMPAGMRKLCYAMETALRASAGPS